jgi:hypothetical protein
MRFLEGMAKGPVEGTMPIGSRAFLNLPALPFEILPSLSCVQTADHQSSTCNQMW